MDVMSHLIIHSYDDDEDSIQWHDIGLKDYFGFESGVDFMEVL